MLPPARTASMSCWPTDAEEDLGGRGRGGARLADTGIVGNGDRREFAPEHGNGLWCAHRQRAIRLEWLRVKVVIAGRQLDPKLPVLAAGEGGHLSQVFGVPDDDGRANRPVGAGALCLYYRAHGAEEHRPLD